MNPSLRYQTRDWGALGIGNAIKRVINRGLSVQSGLFPSRPWILLTKKSICTNDVGLYSEFLWGQVDSFMHLCPWLQYQGQKLQYQGENYAIIFLRIMDKILKKVIGEGLFRELMTIPFVGMNCYLLVVPNFFIKDNLRRVVATMTGFVPSTQKRASQFA